MLAHDTTQINVAYVETKSANTSYMTGFSPQAPVVTSASQILLTGQQISPATVQSVSSAQDPGTVSEIKRAGEHQSKKHRHAIKNADV